MLLSAACSLLAPRQAVYRVGANREASEHVGRFRLGQTEQGSYVVTMLSSIPPRLQEEMEIGDQGTASEPMERQIPLRLRASLVAVRGAVESAQAGEGGAFDRSVALGASANLCEALEQLVEVAGDIDVSFAWARTRPILDRSIQNRPIEFTRHDAPILRQASRTFRAKQPRENFEAFGHVFRLRRDKGEKYGSATFKVEFDGKMQSVNSSLNDPDYSVVTNAHRDRLPIKLVGDLIRQGSRWQLDRARFLPLPGSEDEEPETGNAQGEGE
jgi:hypothetical protein